MNYVLETQENDCEEIVTCAYTLGKRCNADLKKSAVYVHNPAKVVSK